MTLIFKQQDKDQSRLLAIFHAICKQLSEEFLWSKKGVSSYDISTHTANSVRHVNMHMLSYSQERKIEKCLSHCFVVGIS